MKTAAQANLVIKKMSHHEVQVECLCDHSEEQRQQQQQKQKSRSQLMVEER